MAGFETNKLWWLAAAGLGYAGYRVVQHLRLADLTGQVVAITGGSRGLGLLLAREFAKQGCRIALCARDERELREAEHDLRNRGAHVLTVVCDVQERGAVDGFITAAAQRFGRVDILVNNAGVIQVGPLDSMTEADFASALDIMFWAPLHATRAVLPQMRARRSGRIVNITSFGGFVSVPHLLPYNCAKFAAVGLSQGLRAELARDGIRVTTIVPWTMRVGSHLNAEFRGQADLEFAWFSLGASVPGLSVSAQRAARQIVAATRRGEAVRMIGAPAKLLTRLHGLFPGLTANVLGWLNRALPDMVGTPGTGARGRDVAPQLRSSLLHMLLRPGYRAAQRTRQFADASEVR